MRPRLVWLTTSVLFLVTAAPAPAAAFSVDDLGFGVSVYGGFPDSDSAFFLDVDTPFADEHIAVLGQDSTSWAAYDLVWSLTNPSGRFLITSSQSAAFSDAGQGSFLSSTASGGIVITPTVPLTIRYAARYDFDLPGDSMTARLSFGALNPDTSESLVTRSLLYNTVFGTGPGFLSFAGEFVMPPGTWSMSYGLSVRADDTSAGNLATASGFMDIEILPEPSSALLCLLAGALGTLRRTRTRSTAAVPRSI